MVKICTVDFPTKLGKCDVVLEESNSNTPYFVLKNDDSEIRICIYQSKYFGENNYILSTEEKEVMIKELNAKNIMITSWDHSESHWAWAAFMWDQVNEESDHEYKESELLNEMIPNYLEL